MVLVYHGKIPEICREVVEIKEIIDRKYAEIFGEARAKRIKEVAERVLRPESFFDSKKEVYEQLSISLGENECNKMLFLLTGGEEIHPDGRIRDKKVQTSVGFYISEGAFQHSGSSDFTERQVASYIHEFDHFVWYALQRTPIYLIKNYLRAAQNPKPENPGDLDGYVRQMIGQRVQEDTMNRNVALDLICNSMEEGFEKANRILDKLVLESIGINVPLEWRHQNKGIYAVKMPGRIIGVTGGGDPFKGKTDREAVDLFLEWEQNLSARTNHELPYVKNLIASVADMKVSRLSITEIKKQNNGKRVKKKGT